jgi:hypothetical protein
MTRAVALLLLATACLPEAEQSAATASGASNYQGPGASQCQALLSCFCDRPGECSCPPDPSSSEGALPPDIPPQHCERDSYVGAAITLCWGAKCYAAAGAPDEAEAAGLSALENLGNADALCSDAPVVGPGSECGTTPDAGVCGYACP